MDMVAVLLAVGLDPQRSIIFHQDHVCTLFLKGRVRLRVLVEFESSRVGLDIELSYADGAVEEDDYMEGGQK